MNKEAELGSDYWSRAADEQVALAAAAIDDFTPAGRENLRREVQQRGIELPTIGEVAHCVRREAVERAVRIQRVFGFVSIVTLALGVLLFVALLSGAQPVNPTGAFSFIAFLAGIPFLLWFRQAYANLLLVGSRETSYRPGWAIGAWFVPILNLWRPYKLMNDLWRRTATENQATQQGSTRSAIPVMWWTTFLCWRVLDGVMAVMTGQPSGRPFIPFVPHLRTTQALSMLAGALAIYLVWRVSQRQRQWPSHLRPLPVPEEVRSWFDGAPRLTPEGERDSP